MCFFVYFYINMTLVVPPQARAFFLKKEGEKRGEALDDNDTFGCTKGVIAGRGGGAGEGC